MKNLLAGFNRLSRKWSVNIKTKTIETVQNEAERKKTRKNWYPSTGGTVL